MILISYFRYFVIGNFTFASVPLLRFQCPYPIQIEVFSNYSTLNYYVNFGFQAANLYNWTFLFFIQCLIFYVIVINILYELKLIAKMCEKVGDAEEKLLEKKSSEKEFIDLESSVSMKLLSQILDELDDKRAKIENTDDQRRSEMKAGTVKTAILLETIVKYHRRVLS